MGVTQPARGLAALQPAVYELCGVAGRAQAPMLMSAPTWNSERGTWNRRSGRAGEFEKEEDQNARHGRVNPCRKSIAGQSLVD